jgi:hypothetical protein
MTHTPCDESGTGVFAGVTFYVICVGPAIVVAYAAIVTRKSRLAIIGFTVRAGVLTLVAIFVAALFWAGGNNCFG